MTVAFENYNIEHLNSGLTELENGLAYRLALGKLKWMHHDLSGSMGSHDNYYTHEK